MSTPIRPIPGHAYGLYSEAAVARTASGDTAALSWAPEISELFVGVNVTAVAGTSPTLTVHVDQQDTNGVWHTLASTAQLSAVGTAALHVNDKVLSGVGSYRVRWVVGGTSPSFTFQAGVSGR